MRISRLIYRYIQIDTDYLFHGPFRPAKLLTIFSVNIASFASIVGIKLPAYIENAAIRSDHKLTIKTFLAAIYDFWVESRMLQIFKNKKPTIIDIGANVGQFMVGAKTMLPNSKVYSFEPDPVTYAFLEKNSKNFKHINTLNLGISSSEGQLKFYKSNESSEWSSLIKPYSGTYQTMKVDCIKLDTFINDRKIKKIDLLKIDVEGAEMLVLRSAVKALEITKYVLIEVSIDRSDSELRSNNVLSYLFGQNFEIDSIGRIFREYKGAPQSSANILLRRKSKK